MDVGEESQKPQNGDNLELKFVSLVRHALGQMVCSRKNKLPNPITPSTNMMLIMTMSTSVSPGAVMKDGRWWEAAG